MSKTLHLKIALSTYIKYNNRLKKVPSNNILFSNKITKIIILRLNT